jgi:peptidoglycan/LPS O-acetylase OafA/YrhL
MANAHPQQPRFGNIDALRGLAALMVIWMHVSEYFVHLTHGAAADSPLFRWAWQFDLGRLGVTLFFAISGFVIGSSIRGERRTASIQFLIKRSLRLYPAFWLSVLASIVLSVWLGEYPFQPAMLLANLSMLPVAFGQLPSTGVYWSLETELVFYVLCWLLFIGRRTNDSASLALISALLVGLFLLMVLHILPRPPHSQWLSMPYHLSLMLWGASVRLLPTQPAQRQTRQQLWFLAHTALVILPPCGALLTYWLHPEPELLRDSVPYLLGLALFWLVCRYVSIQNRFCLWLGAISYSLYLFHPMVFKLVGTAVSRWPEHLGQQPLAVYLFGCMLLTVLVATPIYYWLEQPAIRLGARLAQAKLPTKPITPEPAIQQQAA